jgi:hypothetical protein
MGISKEKFERVELIGDSALSGTNHDIQRAQLVVLLEIARGMVAAEPDTKFVPPNERIAEEMYGKPEPRKLNTEWLTVRELYGKLEGYINAGRGDDHVFVGDGASSVVATKVLDCETSDGGSDYICIVPFTGHQSPIADKLKICKKLCTSGKFETGQGVCAAICMQQLGSPRSSPHGCTYAMGVHGKLADTLMADD